MASAMRFAGSQLYIPSATPPAAKTITGLTIASPAVFTSTAHGLSNGDVVYIDNIVGTTQINGIFGVVAATAANTFQLQVASGLLSTVGMTAYVSGGNAQPYTMVLMCEAKSINFTGGSVDQTETTGMCDLTKTYEAGLADSGSMTVSANKLAQGAVQIALRTLKTSGSKFPVRIAFPTPATNGNVIVPCFVQTDNWQGAVGQAWAGDFGFKQTAQEIYYV